MAVAGTKVFDDFAREVRGVVRDEMERSGVAIEPWKVVGTDPLTFERVMGDDVLEHGDEDLEVAQQVLEYHARYGISVGDVITMISHGGPDAGDWTALGVLNERDDFPGGPPAGPAGGVLAGAYPSPGFAVDMATQAELNAEVAARAAALAAHEADSTNVHGIADAALLARRDVDNAFSAIQSFPAGGIVLGGSASLYSPEADVLQTDDALRVARALVGDPAFIARPVGAAVGRWAVLGDGKMEVGDGVNARDTSLYRSAAATWRTDGNLIVGGRLTAQGEGTTLAQAWHKVGDPGEPAFANGWANHLAGYREAFFWKDAFGVVHIAGLVKSGNIDAAIFTLPAGYRPALREMFVVVWANSVGAPAVGRIDIFPDGAILPRAPVTSNPQWLTLSGITFPAYQ